MTEPALSGAALVEQICSTRPGSDRLALWRLGQSGFILRYRDLVLLLDPYLSQRPAGDEATRRRLLRAPLEAAQVTFCDLVLVTGGEPDLFDADALPALLEASPNALLVLPAPHAARAGELGVPDERLVPIRDGEVFEFGDLDIHIVPACADGFDPETEADSQAVGYVVQADSLTLYHTGVTLPYRGQTERLASLVPNLALLPISGRSAGQQAQGSTATLTPAEAARLAVAIGAEAVVPHHYDMFACDNADADAFRDLVGQHYPDLRPVILQAGERWLYPGDSA